MSKFKILVVLLVTLAIPSWAESTEQPNAGAHTEFEAGIAALDKGAHKHAIQHFSTAIQSGELSGKELSRAFSNRATASAQLRRYEGAIEDFTQALILNPVHAAAWLGRASAYLETDQFRNAYNDIEELFEFEKILPRHGTSWAAPDWLFEMLSTYRAILWQPFASTRITPTTGMGLVSATRE